MLLKLTNKLSHCDCTIRVFCYSWVDVHKEELSKMNSPLEFKLHRLKFVTLLDSGMLQEALQYSKLFGQFANKHKKGIQYLLCNQIFCAMIFSQFPLGQFSHLVQIL